MHIDKESIVWGPLMQRIKLDQSVIDFLWSGANAIRGVDELNAEHLLAGAMHDEWSYDFSAMNKFSHLIKPYIKSYTEDLSRHISKNVPDSWRLLALWVNFQKSGDYNPLHDHTGDLSFVIYLNIPEELKTEKKVLGYKGRGPDPGSITFVHGDTRPPFYDARKFFLPENGDMFIFPSCLYHTVNPFKTEGITRVSVSGNLVFNV
jgi:hypothetical protein